jgi:fructose-1-phosphate kinase PfkB-like protein
MLSKQGGQQTCEDKVLLAQFLGMGPEGDAVSDMLQSKYGLSDALTIRNNAPLRTCTTIVGADQATELVETSGEVTPFEMKAFQNKVEEMTNQGGRANCVCIMGSMPPGCDEDTYADLTSRLADSNSLVLIDSVIGLEPLLASLKTTFGSNEAKQGGAVLKLNAAEICKLAGVAKGAGETDQVTLEELTASALGFVTKYANAIGALDYLCITDGKVRNPWAMDTSNLTVDRHFLHFI